MTCLVLLDSVRPIARSGHTYRSRRCYSLDVRESSVSQSSIEGLAGEVVAGVRFVMDYVELYFDGPILRVLFGPTLVDGEIETRFPEPGSRDALCGLIGDTVESVSVADTRFRCSWRQGEEFSFLFAARTAMGQRPRILWPGRTSRSKSSCSTDIQRRVGSRVCRRGIP